MDLLTLDELQRRCDILSEPNAWVSPEELLLEWLRSVQKVLADFETTSLNTEDKKARIGALAKKLLQK